MSDYHSFIYDTVGRRIIGDFEGAYRGCDDVWPTQHDVDLVKYRSVAEILRSLGSGARLADIGAGYGDFVATLVAQGLDAVGYDISPSAVERGRARFGLAGRLQVGDLKQGIPLPAGTLDVISLFGVIWFLLDDLESSLRELRRLLKPGGHLVVSLSMVPDPIGGEIIGDYDALLEWLRRFFRVREAVLTYLPSDVAAGTPLAQCATDFVVYCRAD